MLRSLGGSQGGRTHYPPMGVCELAGDLERPVYLIKNESEGNKGPRSHSSPARPMSVLHPLCSSEVGRCPRGGSLGPGPGPPPRPRAAEALA